MPGLVRGMARTAAVVGTATATRNAVNRRQADKNVAAYSQAVENQAPPPQEYAPPPRVRPATSTGRRCDHAVGTPGRTQGSRNSHRGRVRRSESETARSDII